MSLSKHSDHMELDCPEPFLFNSLKHHTDTIIALINAIKVSGANKQDVANTLLRIGNSMIDIYYGDLTVFIITEEIAAYLKSIASYEFDGYRRFIDANPKQYQLVTLSDGSNWTLLSGKQRNNYIHIHPSRGSKYTIRARAIALKTAIYLRAFFMGRIENEDMVLLVNEIRKDLMDGPPIKNEIYTRGIRRVLEIL